MNPSPFAPNVLSNLPYAANLDVAASAAAAMMPLEQSLLSPALFRREIRIDTMDCRGTHPQVASRGMGTAPADHS